MEDGQSGKREEEEGKKKGREEGRERGSEKERTSKTLQGRFFSLLFDFSFFDLNCCTISSNISSQGILSSSRLGRRYPWRPLFFKRKSCKKKRSEKSGAMVHQRERHGVDDWLEELETRRSG